MLLWSQLESEAVRELLKQTKGSFKSGKVPETLVDFLLEADRVAVQFDRDMERASMEGSFSDMMRAFSKNQQALQRTSDEFRVKMAVLEKQFDQRLEDEIALVKEEWGLEGSPAEGRSSPPQDIDAVMQTTQAVLSGLLSVGAAWLAVWLCGLGGLQSLYVWGVPEGSTVLQVAGGTAAFTGAYVALLGAQLEVSKKDGDLRVVLDEEMGDMAEAAQGVPTWVLLLCAGGMAYGETVIR